MKRKLITALVLMAVGNQASLILDPVLDWWKAPPTPPSREVQQLVESLNKADGWVFNYGELGGIRRNRVNVTTGHFFADVNVVNDSNISSTKQECNNQFTYSELRAINKAASNCTKKLAARVLETAAESHELKGGLAQEKAAQEKVAQGK